MEAIFSGTVCLCVFRALTGLEIGAVWSIPTSSGDPLPPSEPIIVGLGALLGLLGAFIAFLFATFHKYVMAVFKKFDLLNPNRTIQRAFAGASVMLAIGVMVPRTM